MAQTLPVRPATRIETAENVFLDHEKRTVPIWEMLRDCPSIMAKLEQLPKNCPFPDVVKEIGEHHQTQPLIAALIAMQGPRAQAQLEHHADRLSPIPKSEKKATRIVREQLARCLFPSAKYKEDTLVIGDIQKDLADTGSHKKDELPFMYDPPHNVGLPQTLKQLAGRLEYARMHLFGNEFCELNVCDKLWADHEFSEAFKIAAQYKHWFEAMESTILKATESRIHVGTILPPDNPRDGNGLF